MKDIKEIQKIFSERLQELITENNLNYSKLAKATGIPRTTFTGWAHCYRTPQIDSLCIIADYFGVSVDYLLGREELR